MHTIPRPYDGSASWPLRIDMPVCNTSQQYDNWSMRVLEAMWWNSQEWDEFVQPNVTVDFDAHTANLTLDGDFFASPYIRSNNSGYPETGMTSSDDALQGTVQVRFRGVLDTYNSDILDINSTTPAWLRTVGFGNNSLNIGNSPNRAGSLRSALWSALGVPFLVAIIVHI